MNEKARIKIAALVTMLFLGAMSAAGALTHSNVPATATSQAPGVSQPAPAPAAIGSPITEQASND